MRRVPGLCASRLGAGIGVQLLGMSLTEPEEIDEAELEGVSDGGRGGDSNCYKNTRNKSV